MAAYVNSHLSDFVPFLARRIKETFTRFPLFQKVYRVTLCCRSDGT